MDQKGASISWYQENDGGAGKANLYIRYSSKIENASGTHIKITVNGKVVNSELFLPNTASKGSSWNKVKVPIQIDRGANTITLETLNDKGLFVDEITAN